MEVKTSVGLVISIKLQTLSTQGLGITFSYYKVTLTFELGPSSLRPNQFQLFNKLNFLGYRKRVTSLPTATSSGTRRTRRSRTLGSTTSIGSRSGYPHTSNVALLTRAVLVTFDSYH